MIRFSALALAASLIAAPAFAAPVSYAIDPSHAQIVYSYNHLGFSKTYGMFGGFEGKINFDAEKPAESSVETEFAINGLLTGWKERDAHFQSADFFNVEVNPTAKFVSTSIEVTGDTTAKITGDLTLNGVTKPVVLDTTMNQNAEHPMLKKPALGFSAKTQILRSEFNMGNFAPFISDEVEISIELEALKAE